MTDHDETDWEGLPIPADEPDDAVIRIWEVDPHIQGGPGDVLWERSWQRMLRIVAGELESFLENQDVDDLLRDGVTIKFRLREMTKEQFLEEIGE